LYSTKAQATCLADRGQTALEVGPPTSLEEAEVDGEGAQVGGEAPDVVEGHAGKVHPPEESDTTSKDTRQTFVTTVLTTVETTVRQSPHTITRVNTVGLAEHVLKGHLDMFVNHVRIPEIQVWSIVSNFTHSLTDTLSLTLPQTFSQTHCLVEQ